MTIAKVGKTSVTVINSLTQDYPDDHIQLTYEMTPKLKPITVRTVKSYRIERKSVISRSHGGKISVCQQFCLTGTVIGIVERWKKEHAWVTILFLSTIIPQESHTRQFCRKQFVEDKKFCYHGNAKKRLLLSIPFNFKRPSSQINLFLKKASQQW